MTERMQGTHSLAQWPFSGAWSSRENEQAGSPGLRFTEAECRVPSGWLAVAMVLFAGRVVLCVALPGSPEVLCSTIPDQPVHALVQGSMRDAKRVQTSWSVSQAPGLPC